MELKASLTKPYKPSERADFIVQNEYKNGYEIRESDTGLEAWGRTEEEEQEHEKEQERQREIAWLKDFLAETDYKIIKCSEYQFVGKVMPYNIEELHAQRQTLRDRINELEG